MCQPPTVYLADWYNIAVASVITIREKRREGGDERKEHYNRTQSNLQWQVYILVCCTSRQKLTPSARACAARIRVVVVVVVLRFGLCRAYRLKRSKESNSRPNQVKLGSSLNVFWIEVTFCLWEILEYGLVWTEVTFCLWKILEYGLVWIEVTFCLWEILEYGLVWNKVTFCLWVILEYGLVWIEVTFCLWEILEYCLVWIEVTFCLWEKLEYGFV